MKFYWILLCIIIVHVSRGLGQEQGRISCEENRGSSQHNDNIQSWNKKYNVTLRIKTSGLHYVVVKRIDYSDKNNTCKITPDDSTFILRRFTTGIQAVQGNYVKKFGKVNNLVIRSFLHGDTAVFHEIDDDTGEYTRTELGFHTINFVKVTRPNKWLAIDVQQHFYKLDYVMLGFTMVGEKCNRERTRDATGEKKLLLKKFPQHAKLIEEYGV